MSPNGLVLSIPSQASLWEVPESPKPALCPIFPPPPPLRPLPNPLAQALCPGSLALQASHFKRMGVPGTFSNQESLWVTRSPPHANGLVSQGWSWSVSSLSGAGTKSSPSPPCTAGPLLAPWADSLMFWSILMIEKSQSIVCFNLSPFKALPLFSLDRLQLQDLTG